MTHSLAVGAAAASEGAEVGSAAEAFMPQASAAAAFTERVLLEQDAVTAIAVWRDAVTGTVR